MSIYSDAFRKELEAVLNRHSIENGSDTPDWILAQYVIGCLESFDRTIGLREKWYGRPPEPVEPPIDREAKERDIIPP